MNWALRNFGILAGAFVILAGQASVESQLAEINGKQMVCQTAQVNLAAVIPSTALEPLRPKAVDKRGRTRVQQIAKR